MKSYSDFLTEDANKILSESSDYHIQKQVQDSLYADMEKASAVLAKFPKGAMGLTPDDVAKTPAFQKAKQDYERIATAVRNFNGPFTKKYKKEIAADIHAKRMAKLAGK